MPGPPGSKFDLDLSGKDRDKAPYFRVHDICSHLSQKGFCLIKGDLPSSARDKAVIEAAKLKKNGAFIRPPREVLCGLLGEAGSAWTHDLCDPTVEAIPEETALRVVEQYISDIGMEVIGGVYAYCGMHIQGRTVGVAHYSRMPEDGSNPPLEDPDEADSYMTLFCRKKIKMVYYVGPSLATLVIAPIGDESEAYQVRIQPGAVLVLRGDVCRCAISPKTTELGITIDIDFFAERRKSRQGSILDQIPCPAVLNEWYMDRFSAIVENNVTEDLPESWLKSARQICLSSTPIRVAQMSHEFPTNVFPSGGCCPFEASVVGGNDCITEIPLFKWDIGVYYDSDPEKVDDFKMYTRHIGVIEQVTCSKMMADMQSFGITPAEEEAIDPRHVMLCESSTSCLRMANLSKNDVKGRDLGIFCGLSGTSAVYYSFMAREAKLGKSSHTSMSNGACANRLSYMLGCNGPSMAIDTEDSSGSSAMDTAMKYMRSGSCGPQALVGSVNFMEHPFMLIICCAAGDISRTGRSRVFDQSSDGFVRSEGAVTILVEKEDEQTREESARALVTGSSLNSKGVSASLTAPSADAIKDALSRAHKDANMPYSFADAAQPHAGGNLLADAVELGTLKAMSASREERPCTIMLRNTCSICGNLGAPSGLVSIARTCAQISGGMHGPCLHLQELFEVADRDDGAGSSTGRLLLLTEAVEAYGITQIVGVSSFGGSGTNVHHVLWGERPGRNDPLTTKSPICWFPSESKVHPMSAPEVEYWIMGTWTGWQKCCKMEREADGVYGYTVTLGENRWETFQIWVDGDKDKILHPPERWGAKERLVSGPNPEKIPGRSLTWVIDGRSQVKHMINQDQFNEYMEAVIAAKEEEREPPEDFKFIVGFKGSYKPPGYEDANASDMPTVEVNDDELGLPGDKYRVRFHDGKYRRVEWNKLPPDAPSMPDAKEHSYSHGYFIVGDTNYWQFTPMKSVDGEQGLYTAELHLLKDGGSRFTVVRDRDWDQAFYPREPNGGTDCRICGPDGVGMPNNWRIDGKLGDIYKVEFRRSVGSDGNDSRSICWEYVRSEKPNFEELAKSHDYFVIGSWDDFSTFSFMQFDRETNSYEREIVIGPSGRETFQILLNKNFLAAVHPSVDESSFRDAGHKLEGPDSNGANICWAVGKDSSDGVAAGDRVKISLTMAGGLPAGIHWSKADVATSRAHADVGCQSEPN